jgi:hypothetical protein
LPKITYTPRDFKPATVAMIDQANAIIEEYQAQGFSLTLRQLYYQFVSRDLLRNRQSEYNRLGSVINYARLAGLVDWEAIEDRTRELVALSHWTSPSDIVRAVAQQYRIDKWDGQPTRIEVWIEKDALVGVIEGICQTNDVAFFSCRGYTSQSEMWVAAQRLERYLDDDQDVIILHLGDHDPSGLDMTRDIEDRLRLFLEGDGYDAGKLEVRRIALTREQIDQYNPPPNPAKITDSRFAGYEAEHGSESWELDALEPSVLAALIRDAVDETRDDDEWSEKVEREDREKVELKFASDNWPKIRGLVGKS